MKKRIVKAFGLVFFVIGFIFIIGLIIPLIHDFLIDAYSVSNYEVKEGIVSEVKLKDKKSNTCEYIVVDNYNIFVKCGKDYKQQFNTGDKTTYYVYKDKAYHNEHQMKSGTFIGKLLDYGLIGTYILIFYLLVHNERKINLWVKEIGGIENTNK